ncbi:MAG: hypothetical protein V9G22_12720 [Ottowia sp.]
MPRTDCPGVETAKGVRVERALPLWHDELGLIGKSDVVEFLPDGAPYPVEYKHGSRHKAADIAACDDLQLAGQALCLETMTGQRGVRRRAVLRQLSNVAEWYPSRPHCAPEVAQVAQAIRQHARQRSTGAATGRRAGSAPLQGLFPARALSTPGHACWH